MIFKKLYAVVLLVIAAAVLSAQSQETEALKFYNNGKLATEIDTDKNGKENWKRY